MFARKGSKLYVMLLEHGEPGVSLPPLAFEGQQLSLVYEPTLNIFNQGGASSVRDFLAYMQANLEAQAYIYYDKNNYKYMYMYIMA